MLFYHVTQAANADAILAHGFRDNERLVGHADDGQPVYLAGVWLSDEPLWDGGPVGGHLPDGWVCIAVEMREGVVTDFYIDNPPECSCREWCVPAEVVNRFPRQLVPEPS
jgi:hypothetical protein